MTGSPYDSAPSRPTPPGARLVACPGCGASIPLRALGQSVMVACPSCGTQIDVSRPDIQIIQKYTLQARQLHVPLGTRGKLRGQLFEVIGAMQRSAVGFRWEEYLLFNPTIGFRWLVYDHGHWSLGQMIRDTSAVNPDAGLPYQGHKFQKYDQNPVVVDWVVGEFYWRVCVGERVVATDYICPPFMLSCERADAEITWTILQYLEPREVEAAFHIESPSRQSLAANQPNSAQAELKSLRGLLSIALVLALLIQIISAHRATDAYLPVGSYDLIHSAREETQVYGPFTFAGNHSVNEFSASAPLKNSWVELDCALVNTSSGESIHFKNAFEFYSGYDSDGYWSEGKSNSTVVIGSVPAGTYNLIVEGSSGDASGRPVASLVQMGLEQDTVAWRNFWICLLVILLYPVYLSYRGGKQESERWSQSPYTPKGSK